MAKLYGTADSTLVKMAYAESMANVPKDLKEIYEHSAKNIKDFATGVSNLYDSIYKQNTDLDNFITETSQAISDDLNTKGGINWEFQNVAHENAVKDVFKEDLKAIGPLGAENATKRNELNRKVNEYLNKMNAQQESFSAILNSGSNRALLTDIGDDRKDLYAAVINDIKNNTDNTKPTYDKDKNDMVYTLNGKSMTWSEITKGLTANDPAYVAGIQKNHVNKLMQTAVAKKGNITADDIALWKKDFLKDINSWDHIRMLENEQLGATGHTIKELLHGQAKNNITGEVETDLLEELYTVLDEIGGVDMDGNGIDKNDSNETTGYRNPANVDILITELKKDLNKYSEFIAGAFGKTVVTDYFNNNPLQQVITPQASPPFPADEANQGFSAKNDPIKKSIINNYWTKLNSGKYGNYNLVDGEWTDGKNKFSGDDMMRAIANELAKQGPQQEGSYYFRNADQWFNILKAHPKFEGFFGGGKGGGGDYSLEDLFSKSDKFSLRNYRHEDNAVKQLKNRFRDMKGLTFKVADGFVGTDAVTATLNGKTYDLNLDIPANEIKDKIADFEAWIKINK